MYKGKYIVAVIPARGGSKSIPKKNIKLFCGLPLIAHSIICAKASKYVDRIILSTDDEQIKKVGELHRAEVPFMRPDNISADDTTDFPVFKHCLDHIESVEKQSVDVLVQLRPTTPVRPEYIIDQAIEHFFSTDADSLRSISIAEPSPYKMWKKQGELIEPLLHLDIPEAYNAPRQKLPKAYWHNGLIDIFHKSTLVEKGSLTGQKVLGYEIDAKYCFDLDTELQWSYAEFMYRKTIKT